MALQPTDLLVIHRPGPGNGALYNCPVKDFFVDSNLGTEDTPGIVRFATVDEVIEGLNNQLVVSPKNMLDAFASPTYVFDGNSFAGDDDYDTSVVPFSVSPTSLPPSTEDAAGPVQLATGDETRDGTITDKAITPAGLRYALNSPIYVFDAGEYDT